jgi:hypothetical protein
MSDEAFVTGMAVLQEIFPKDLSPATTRIYRETCDRLSDDVWLAAVRRVAGVHRFFPVPAELLAAADAIVANAHGIVNPDAAWEQVTAIARSWSPQTTVRGRLDESIWLALDAVGGIRAVALAESGPEIARLERQFRSAYRRIFERTTEPLTSLRLPTEDRAALPDVSRT